MACQNKRPAVVEMFYIIVKRGHCVLFGCTAQKIISVFLRQGQTRCRITLSVIGCVYVTHSFKCGCLQFIRHLGAETHHVVVYFAYVRVG
ncbi:MAG: hypothetical protein JMHAAFGB_01085 [Dehalococcoides mccartyi]|nr:hypothetical protein [Dehalococcoides mccartyi]